MSDKGFKIYLSFKNKEIAEKWLKSRGIQAEFAKTQIINVIVKDNDGKVKKNGRE